ncbi:MAG: hypothetical protein ACLFNW_10675 [Desulfobacterales bacterium]
MPKLKKHPNHLRAFKWAQTLAAAWQGGFAQRLLYLFKLHELEREAVKTIPGREIGEPGLLYVFLYPCQAENLKDHQLPGDVDMEFVCLAVTSPVLHEKKEAAAFCGVTVRQIERWASGEFGRSREPLHCVKYKHRSLFLERELRKYMRRHRCGGLQKHKSQVFQAKLLPGFTNQTNREDHDESGFEQDDK